MARVVDYYLSPVSPYSYLGSERFANITRDANATVNVLAIDLTKVFPATGGLPLKQRAPERQAYRLLELRRWRDYLDIPLVLEPKYFPVDANPASLMIIAARRQGLDALSLAQRMLRAVWAEEANIADVNTITALANDVGMDGKGLADFSTEADIAAEYERDTQQAIQRGVFGVPTYVIDDELFWGQDRLDFVARTLG